MFLPRANEQISLVNPTQPQPLRQILGQSSVVIVASSLGLPRS
jgi:hypothetical protein